MAETATYDDRVKDWPGRWQDSETRKSIHQDRATDELRAQAASVPRQLRIGRGLTISVDNEAPAAKPAPGRATPTPESINIDELWESLTPSQRRLNRPGFVETQLVECSSAIGGA